MQSSPVEKLKRHLCDHGPMSVAEYMAWCLTDDGTAYYRRGNPIGASGDFITAPEVSQIFGELIAVWAITIWQSMGKPRPFVFGELGPGRGTLMHDAMRAAGTVAGFREAAQVHLVESSSTLRDAQNEALAPLCKPEWHRSLTAMPREPLIIVANEFFDALPIEQHIYQNGGWHKRVIALNGSNGPSFAVGRLSVPPAELLPSKEPHEGDILEHRPASAAMIEEIGRRAEEAPVAVLIVDYGYERRDYGDTLQAVHEHSYAPPLEAPGEVDISAHVNFAELAHAAELAGLKVWGPVSQSEFLLSLGLEQRLRQLMNSASQEQRASLYLGARRLVDPFQMGSLFKVMAITSKGLAAPPPFAEPANDGGR